jgi:NAD(P)-dependent dehydrogenase (short-subunit alcohol dehydrogenase family)
MSGDSPRVCLLTGASGRLGTLFCRLYGHRYRIAAVYHTRRVAQSSQMSWHVDPLDPAIRRPVSVPGFAAFAADLGDPRQRPRIIEFALDTFGRVDVLVNAAAITHCAPLLGADVSDANVARMFAVNTLAPLGLAVDLANRFWRTRVEENTALNRNIVNVSSTSGAYVFAQQGSYSASKAALNMLTCHLAEEFAAIGVRVNAIAPDSFPHAVSTESVCDAIARMDQGTLNGELLLIEQQGEPARA